MSQDANTNIFDELNGKQLSSVEFVQDYLQLRFDGPCINVYNPLTVTIGDEEKTSWEIGFRDLLCAQIGKIVGKVTFEEDKQLNIQFEDYSEIIVSLREEHYSSPEAVYAHGFANNQWLAV